MNRFTTRLCALFSAAFFTVVILSGIDALATMDAASTLVAEAAHAPRG